MTFLACFPQPRHWKALFVSLGQVYQQTKMYTVSELISYNLREHSLQINSICAGAAAEFALEQCLIRLRKLWEEKEFKLAKHIPNIKQKKGKIHTTELILKVRVFLVVKLTQMVGHSFVM